MNTKITLTHNKLSHKCFFIGKELDLDTVKEVVTRNGYTFSDDGGGVGETKDIIFLDKEGEELYRINLGYGIYFNKDEIKELIKRLQSRDK